MFQPQLRKIILLLLVIGGPFACFRIAAQAPTHVVIMHTNDIHGQLVPRNGVGGVAEMATVIRRVHPDLILDAGDLFTGTFLSDEFKGEPTIGVLNKIGYTAVTVGNHEFDYGQAALRTRAREAKFPFLSANLDTPVAEIKKYLIVPAKGIRFGIVGITTEEVVTTTHPKNLGGVVVKDVVKSIAELLPEVGRRADFIIVIAHVTDEEERRIALAFPEIRLIIGGHNHSALGPIRIGETLVAKTGNVGRNVGQVDLEFTGTTLTGMQAKLIPVQNVPPDIEVAKILSPFLEKVARKTAEQIGEATDDLLSSPSSESPLPNLIADAFREKGKTQIGIQNLGGIRTRISKGPITWGNVFEVLPFQNTMVTLKLSGAQLKKTLNTMLLGVSGLRIQYDLQRPAGERLISVTLADGTPIEDEEYYSVTTNDFVVAGGDGLTELGRGREIRDTGVLLRDVLVDFVRARRVITPALDGRIAIQ
jgi:5'-nucleotidase / UDP-sugar diphosphatase